MTTQSPTFAQMLREFVLARHDPATCEREGIAEMSGIDLMHWLQQHEPDTADEVIRGAYGIPRLAESAARFGVDAAELQAHCNAGDVVEWLESLGHHIPRVSEELTPDQQRRRTEAAQRLEQGGGGSWEYVPKVPSGVLPTGQTFRNFNPQRHGVKAAYDAVLAWVRGGSSKPILTLQGPAGTGKSHLLLAAANTLRDRGENVIYRTDERFYEEWRAGLFNQGPDAPAAFRDVDWFILDDAWRSGQSDFTAGILDSFVDWRYQRGMRTLLTTNVQPPSPRLFDRLTDRAVATYIDMTGATSYRQEARG